MFFFSIWITIKVRKNINLSCGTEGCDIMEKKLCILEDNKLCDNCCECDTCDLEPTKVCDNCARCLDVEKEYRTYTVDDLVKVEESHKKARLQNSKLMRKLIGIKDFSRRMIVMR